MADESSWAAREVEIEWRFCGAPELWRRRENAGLAVTAVQHVRRMRGGAQSHLMRCADGNFYVVKFQDNPQHTRVLANEMLATRLAAAIGLTVPATEVVEVDRWLVEHTSDLRFELVGGRCV